uniref:Ycf29 n=1 Tax=Leachiella pacifica TaxID=282357 RepID=A0A3S8UVR9_9FLOR|nr:ycf29 [Leachiella pacifica]
MKNKIKILLVDDDNNLRKLLLNYLRTVGYVAYSVESVCKALVFMKKNIPNLIISDIIMKGLDGYDFIRFIKLNDILFYIPVIFLTAKGMIKDRVKGYNLGCKAYVVKPFNLYELVAIIDNIFYYQNRQKEINLFFNFQELNSFNFTPREQTVLILLLQGYMNKEIANNLNLSLRNVEKYVSRLLEKTNSRNRVNLMRLLFIKNKGE